MKNFLLNLNCLLIMAYSLGFIDLSGTPFSPYHYLPGYMVVSIIYIWCTVTLYLMLGRVPVFEEPRKRLLIVGSVMSVAVLVGIWIIRTAH
ncbi:MULTISPECIES: hypothetical protein [Emticicia]|uniref:hypothetical protein n=1 Tax=Emticicia TaxID=312278 RepID=UPI0020A03329|nr:MULTISPECIES: hypothetical protein [Emticicia]UTA66851.1 hypothetical protein MB380_14695 [Emticicia sp. 21SJ11W-3]